MEHKQYDPSKLSIVPIGSVHVNSWNPKDTETKEFKQVIRSLKLYGFRQPLLVRNSTSKKGYEILDGEQRHTAAKQLGYTDVPVYNLGDVSDEEAKAATLWMEVQVPFNEVDLSHLVVELHNMEMELPYTEAQIADFAQMAQFDFDNFGDNGDDGDEGQPDVKTLNIKMNADQFEVVMDTITHVKNEYECNEARALELIIAEYRSGIDISD